jgi:hypothetical protein
VYGSIMSQVNSDGIFLFSSFTKWPPANILIWCPTFLHECLIPFYVECCNNSHLRLQNLHFWVHPIAFCFNPLIESSHFIKISLKTFLLNSSSLFWIISYNLLIAKFNSNNSYLSNYW